MKRILAAILAACCILPLAACASDPTPAETTAADTAAVTEPTEPTEEETTVEETTIEETTADIPEVSPPTADYISIAVLAAIICGAVIAFGKKK